jgi:tetratricopeptide (TPR) repeat protein
VPDIDLSNYVAAVDRLAETIRTDWPGYQAWLDWRRESGSGGSHVPEPANSIRPHLCAALELRDQVGAAVRNGQTLGAGGLQTLQATDGRLKALSATMLPLIEELLPKWRGSSVPDSDRWWWRLDELAADESRESENWNVPAVLSITLALALLTTIVARFWSGESDAPSILTNALLAAIAGGTLTSFGRTTIDKALLWVNVPRRWLARAKAVVAFVVLVGVAIFWSLLPAVADSYVASGRTDTERKAYTEALSSLERAVALQPDNVEGHYELGRVHAALNNYEKASSELARAIELDHRHLRAILDLSRVKILTRDYPRALHWLNVAKSQLPAEVEGGHELRYRFFKNLAWYRIRLIVERSPDVPEDAHVFLVGKAQGAARSAVGEGGRADAYALLGWAYYIEPAFDSATENWSKCCTRVIRFGDDLEDEFRQQMLLARIEGADVCGKEDDEEMFGGE